MKPFAHYQYVGGKMSPRDKQEANSKFWNQGKWTNFILPFLPKNCQELSLVDLGCNAGLFLKLAEDKGFDKIIVIKRQFDGQLSIVKKMEASMISKEGGLKEPLNTYQ
jgi:hypothetical protein